MAVNLKVMASWRMPVAVSPAPNPAVVAKAQRRQFTAACKSTIVEEADHGTDPGKGMTWKPMA